MLNNKVPILALGFIIILVLIVFSITTDNSVEEEIPTPIALECEGVMYEDYYDLRCREK